MTTNSIKIRSVQFLGRVGWVQLSKVGDEGFRWDMPVAMKCRSYSVTLDELLESRRARGEVIKRQSDEIERLRGAITTVLFDPDLPPLAAQTLTEMLGSPFAPDRTSDE